MSETGNTQSEGFLSTGCSWRAAGAREALCQRTHRHGLQRHPVVGAHRVNFEAFRFYKERGFSIRLYVFHDQSQI